MISPFNFPLILASARSPRRWRWATPSSSSPTRVRRSPAASSWPASSRRRGCPKGCSTCCPAAPTRARRSSPTRRCGSSPSPAPPPPAARSGSSAGRLLKRAHLELGGNSALIVLDDADLDVAVSAAAFGLVHAPGPDLHDRRTPPGARVDRRRVRRTRWPRRPTRLPVGDPAVEQVALGPIIDAAPAGQDPRHRDRHRDGGRQAGRRRHVRGAVLPADRAGRRPARQPGVRRGDLRPGRPRRALLHTGRGRRAGQRHRVRPVARHPPAT